MLRCRRLKRQPKQLPDELNGVPIDGGPHVEANDLKGRQPEGQRQQAEGPEIKGPHLRISDFPKPVAEEGRALTLPNTLRELNALFRWPSHLHAREDVLIFVHSHRLIPPFTTKAASSTTRTTTPAIRESRRAR